MHLILLQIDKIVYLTVPTLTLGNEHIIILSQSAFVLNVESLAR
jgi:hypothetical protein